MTYAIETINLTKHFDRIIAVNDINMQIDTGGIVGLVGPNGAGKTTTLKLLTGSIQPSRGTARINGWDTQTKGVISRMSLGYVPEEINVYPNDLRGTTFVRYMAELKGLTRTIAKKESYKMLKYVGMEQFAERKIAKMSSGMKQRIGLAQALVGNPDTIIADEPLAFLDPVGKQEIKTFFKQLVKEEHKTLFISSHILAEVEALVKYVYILNRGQIVSFGRLDHLLKSASNDFIVSVSKTETIRDRLIELPSICNVDINSDELYITTNNPEILFKELPRIVAAENAFLRKLHPVQDSLESYFFNVIKLKE